MTLPRNASEKFQPMFGSDVLKHVAMGFPKQLKGPVKRRGETVSVLRRAW